MSIKLRLKYRFRSLRQFLNSLRLPAWFFSGYTRASVVGFIVVFGIGYLFQVNEVSTSGYVVHTLEKQIASISDETKKLQSEIASVQSLTSIQKRVEDTAKDMTLVSASDIRYVRASEKTALAR